MKRILSIIFDSESIIGKILCGLIYTLIYDLAYEGYVFHLFSYMGGVDYVQMNIVYRVTWLLLSVFPLMAYNGLKSVASFLCLFLYIFVYVPLIHALFVLYGIDLLTLYSYSLTLCLFFTLFFQVGVRWSLFKNIEIKQHIPFRVIEIVTIIITFIFLAIRAKSMHFVNFFSESDLLYELREKNSEEVGSMAIVVYLQGGLSGAFYPFLLINYLRSKSWLKSFAVLVGYTLLFMVDMQKLTFFIPFFLVGFYFLMKLKANVIETRLHSFLLYSISFLLLLLYPTESEDGLLFIISFIVILRTVCVTGWLTQMYMHFFRDNPYTHYGHINIVNALTGAYPYNAPLGKVVSYGAQNANATFFLTDGIAADGYIGIILIGILFLIMLHFINAVSFRYKSTDLLVIFLPTLTYVLNTSLFTTLLSSGLLVLIMIITFADCPIIDKNESKTSDKETIIREN